MKLGVNHIEMDCVGDRRKHVNEELAAERKHEHKLVSQTARAPALQHQHQQATLHPCVENG